MRWKSRISFDVVSCFRHFSRNAFPLSRSRVHTPKYLAPSKIVETSRKIRDLPTLERIETERNEGVRSFPPAPLKTHLGKNFLCGIYSVRVCYVCTNDCARFLLLRAPLSGRLPAQPAEGQADDHGRGSGALQPQPLRQRKGLPQVSHARGAQLRGPETVGDPLLGDVDCVRLCTIRT